MAKLRVSLDKLEKYAEGHGGYDLTKVGEGARKIVLSFVPVFPEALEKGEGNPPRVVMHGILSNGTVEFDRVETEDPQGIIHERSLEEAELVYRSWLDFIEENY